MSESPPWVTIGATTNETDRTGCTVLLFDHLSPAVVDVRGGAPGTRETSLLEMGRMMGAVDALVLTGGSAFGLGVCDGVMRFLLERGRGFQTAAIPVPIVPGAVIFDLAVGQASWPNADDGYRAAVSAQPIAKVHSGRWGAGTGATVAKLGNRPNSGGIGISTVAVGEATVTAIVVLNAVGDIVEPSTARPLASAGDAAIGRPSGRDLVLANAATANAGENTTIGAILIDGVVERDALLRCCVAAHGAMARCVVPAHTIFDGDTFFAVAREEGTTLPSETLILASATEVAVEQAIVSIFGS